MQNQKKVLHAFILAQALTSGVLAGISSPALANPSNGTVTQGAATIVNTPAELQINQTSQKALIEWGSFDIGAGETTRFYQPGRNSVALNRVVSSNQASAINGSLQANGHVLVINPNGILIGRGGNIDTAGFIATTVDMSDNAFMNATSGTYDFNIPGRADAAVENRGQISVSDEGLAALVAPTVRNSGTIEGNLATVHLAGGDTFGVDLYGDGLFYLAAGPASSARQVEVDNSGTIMTEGGRVRISTADAGNLLAGVINNTGVIEAASLVNRNGVIELVGNGADVASSGTMDVSGANNAGRITVKGRNIAAAGNINANTTAGGQGGHIELFGTGNTNITGNIAANGAGEGGNIEVRGNNISLGAAGILAAEATSAGKGGHIDLFGGNSATIDGLARASGVDGGGNIEARGNTVTVNGDAVAEGTVTGEGGHIDLVGGDRTTINGGLKAGGQNGGNGHIKARGDNVSTTASAVLTTSGGSIRFLGNDLIDIGGGAFSADHFNMDAPEVDFTGDTHLTQTGLFLNANRIDLDATIYDAALNALTDPLRFTSNASIVNVLSDKARVQQGIYLAGHGATVTVSGGFYPENLIIDRSLMLQGDGTRPVLSGISAQSPVITVAADDITIRGFDIDSQNSASGIRLTGNNNISILDNHVFKGPVGIDALVVGNGLIRLAGNQLTDNARGANFGSGLVDLTGQGNTITGGNTALLFQKTGTLDLVNDTLGATRFSGQSDFYVDLEDGALFAPGNPTLIDGAQATFDGLQGSLLTASQLQNVEGKLHDFDDNATLGQIFQGAATTTIPGSLLFRLDPLGRPIISYADNVIVYNPPFELIETLTLDTDVSIRLKAAPAGVNTVTSLNDIAPAAGGDMNESELANIEPAAGTTGRPDIDCANNFLDNKPCEVQ